MHSITIVYNIEHIGRWRPSRMIVIFNSIKLESLRTNTPTLAEFLLHSLKEAVGEI